MSADFSAYLSVDFVLDVVSHDRDLSGNFTDVIRLQLAELRMVTADFAADFTGDGLADALPPRDLLARFSPVSGNKYPGKAPSYKLCFMN